MQTFCALGRLLLRPSEQLRDAMAPIRNRLAGDPHLSAKRRRALDNLCRRLSRHDLIAAQKHYKYCFYTRFSLYLFEQNHQDTQERTDARLALNEIYRQSDLELNDYELPDYLPLVCEALAQMDETDAYRLLCELQPNLMKLAYKLDTISSDYAAVCHALVELIPDTHRTTYSVPLQPATSFFKRKPYVKSDGRRLL